jgi:hypothetical protein
LAKSRLNKYSVSAQQKYYKLYNYFEMTISKDHITVSDWRRRVGFDGSLSNNIKKEARRLAELNYFKQAEIMRNLLFFLYSGRVSVLDLIDCISSNDKQLNCCDIQSYILNAANSYR